MLYEFLPPYSPDYNPIEPSFSAIKAHIRRDGGIIREAMNSKGNEQTLSLLFDAIWSVTAEDAAGWFRRSGYI